MTPSSTPAPGSLPPTRQTRHSSLLSRLAIPGLCLLSALAGPPAHAAPVAAPPPDPHQHRERTCFQTGHAYAHFINLRSDVAIVYGIDSGLPERIRTWRDRGYRIHVMTGVSWGNYQDYLYGRFDGVNHEDEAQTDRAGNKISHGGDVYYMCPGENFGRFLSLGVHRALEAGTEAVHLEEPEFWVRAGYSEGFKRAWKQHYAEDWIPPHQSPDAQWRASKLKYSLYRRALEQVFDSVQEWNRQHQRSVRCYVPTHSLLNYAHWRIVSPESSLARLNGCDGYIAQVWTGTSRTPNRYRGLRRERTFETAFLEYGAMQNLVRATGRTVWYLNDPVEDNPDHDWGDYQRNWESTLVASLLQPDVWRFEVMPWPERVFGGRYPAAADPKQKTKIPPAYAAELQTVLQALNQMDQPKTSWEAGTPNLGVVISDSLMFQRGEPSPSDPDLSHFYGLALPLLKRGAPIDPVQLENLAAPSGTADLERHRLLLMTYQGMKPLSSDVHTPIARWVRKGGVLLFVDDDSDPYHHVREWWNQTTPPYATPRHHLFEQLGLPINTPPGLHRVGKGLLAFHNANPAQLAASPEGDTHLITWVRQAMSARKWKWTETNHLLLRRGPFVIAAGLEESIAGPPRQLTGRFISLFDPDLPVRTTIELTPGSRHLLLDLDQTTTKNPTTLASACKTWPASSNPNAVSFTVEGIANTPGIVLLRYPRKPTHVSLEDQPVQFEYDPAHLLLRVRFPNEARPRTLRIETSGSPSNVQRSTLNRPNPKS